MDGYLIFIIFFELYIQFLTYPKVSRRVETFENSLKIETVKFRHLTEGEAIPKLEQ